MNTNSIPASPSYNQGQVASGQHLSQACDVRPAAAGRLPSIGQSGLNGIERNVMHISHEQILSQCSRVQRQTCERVLRSAESIASANQAIRNAQRAWTRSMQILEADGNQL